MLRVTVLAPRIFRWLLKVWKNLCTLVLSHQVLICFEAILCNLPAANERLQRDFCVKEMLSGNSCSMLWWPVARKYWLRICIYISGINPWLQTVTIYTTSFKFIRLFVFTTHYTFAQYNSYKNNNCFSININKRFFLIKTNYVVWEVEYNWIWMQNVD